MFFQSLSPGLAPLKGEGSLAPLRDSSPGRSLGGSLGASSARGGGTLGGTSLGSGPLGGGSLGRSSLGGGSLGGSLGKSSLGAGSLGPLGLIKEPPGVSLA